jgi:pheromone alpha factor receptor
VESFTFTTSLNLPDSLPIMTNLTSNIIGNTTFDPFQQSLTFTDAYGEAFPVSLAELDDFFLYGLQNCVIAGTQVGAAAILLVVLLLLTKPDKRTTPIFIVNTLALVFDIIRCVLSCLYFTGPFEETYAYFSEDYSHVHNQDYAMSVLKAIFSLLMLVCVETSLCLQIQVVCVTLRRAYRHAIFALSTLIASTAISVRFAFMVENAILVVQTKQESSLYQLDSAANITITLSICWFCAVFVAKLGVALRQRQKLGLGQFGPMQVIFIMGCQTLIIPGKSHRISLYRHKLTTYDSRLLDPSILRTLGHEFVHSHRGGTLLASIVSMGFSVPRYALPPIEAEPFQSPDAWQRRKSIDGTYGRVQQRYWPCQSREHKRDSY